MGRIDKLRTVLSSVVRNGLYNVRHPVEPLKKGVRDIPKLPKAAYLAGRAALRKATTLGGRI